MLKFCLVLSLLLLPAATSAQTPAGQIIAPVQSATITFCESVDDQWNPVNPSDSAPLNTPFCFLTKLRDPVKVESLGWIIHKVGEDGADLSFVTELQMGSRPDARWFCTTEPYVFTEAGRYRVYLMDWKKRQVNVHKGNYSDYLAKGELNISQ